MVKALPFRFEQCFGPFTMLLVKGSSETRLFRHLSNHVFWSPKIHEVFFGVQKYMKYEDHLFLENVQILI